jgi:hypothetical protein
MARNGATMVRGRFSSTNTPAQIRERLAELEEIAQAAAVNAKRALDSIGRAHVSGHALLSEICHYERGIRTRQPKFVNSDDTRRQLTADLVEAVIAGGFIAVPVDDGAPAAGVRFVDTEPARLYEELRITAAATRADARSFAAEHAEALRKEEAKEAARRVKQALKGDDPVEIAAAIKGLPAVPDENTLTTADL